MNSVTEQVRMSHSGDPHTSREAAARVRQSKKAAIYGAVAAIMARTPMTPAEVAAVYATGWAPYGYPDADLQEIRRRMTEMQHDLDRIEPVVVGTQRDGKPQYMTRLGQRVMRLVGGAS